MENVNVQQLLAACIGQNANGVGLKVKTSAFTAEAGTDLIQYLANATDPWEAIRKCIQNDGTHTFLNLTEVPA